jgi:hypothetical protein
MTYAAFPLYLVRTSWLGLGSSGREIAVQGVLDLGAKMASRVALTACAARGLSGRTDLFLVVEAEEPADLEAFLQHWALTTAGRHLETLDLYLGSAALGKVDAQILGLYGLRGFPTGAGVERASRLAEEVGISWRVWQCAGPASLDFLILAGAASPAELAVLRGRLAVDPEIRAVPLTLSPLALGRRLPLEEALARFG